MPSPSSSQTSAPGAGARAPRRRSGGWFRAARRDSSNCPPGSRVIEHRASFSSAMTLPSSTTGFQPNRIIPWSKRADAVRPLIGRPLQIARRKTNFSCSVPTRHAAGGLLPASWYSTSCRLSVIGGPGDVRRGRHRRRYSKVHDNRSAERGDRQPPDASSTGPGAAPIAGDSLKGRQRGERGRLGAQHPRAKPDAGNKWEICRERQAPFRQSRLPGRSASPPALSGEKPASASAIGAPPPVSSQTISRRSGRPAGEQARRAASRLANLGHRQALALLGGGDRRAPQPLAVEPLGLGARGHHRHEGADAQLGRPSRSANRAAAA